MKRSWEGLLAFFFLCDGVIEESVEKKRICYRKILHVLGDSRQMLLESHCLPSTAANDLRWSSHG